MLLQMALFHKILHFKFEPFYVNIYYIYIYTSPIGSVLWSTLTNLVDQLNGRI